MPSPGTITRRSRTLKCCTSRSASVSRNRRKQSSFSFFRHRGQVAACPVLPRLQRPHSLQGFLADLRIGVAGQLLQLRHARLIATTREYAAYPDFFILRPRREGPV